MQLKEIKSIWGDIKGEVIDFKYSHNGKIFDCTMLPKALCQNDGKDCIWAFVDSLKKGETCSFKPVYIENILNIMGEDLTSIQTTFEFVERENIEPKKYDKNGYYHLKSAFIDIHMVPIGLCWETDLTEFKITKVNYTQHPSQVRVGATYKHRRLKSVTLSYHLNDGTEAPFPYNGYDGNIDLLNELEVLDHKYKKNTYKKRYFQSEALQEGKIFIYKDTGMHLKLEYTHDSYYEYGQEYYKFKILETYFLDDYHIEHGFVENMIFCLPFHHKSLKCIDVKFNRFRH